MKRFARKNLWPALILGLSFASTALAVPVSPGDNGPPAAPEPGLILMVVAGLVLGGGYILLRRRLARKASN